MRKTQLERILNSRANKCEKKMMGWDRERILESEMMIGCGDESPQKNWMSGVCSGDDVMGANDLVGGLK